MMIKVKKIDGRSVRMPERNYVEMPDTIVTVPENQFYLRRLRDKDIERVQSGGRKPSKLPTPDKETGSK